MSRPNAALFNRETFPQAMDATGHQVIHQVITICHRIKDVGKRAFSFLRNRYLLVAEVVVDCSVSVTVPARNAWLNPQAPIPWDFQQIRVSLVFT